MDDGVVGAALLVVDDATAGAPLCGLEAEHLHAPTAKQIKHIKTAS